MAKALMKKFATGLLVSAGIDRIGRWLNRKKLLTVMYHGVTRRSYCPPVWTQLPVDVFEAQLRFLKKHYTPVGLSDVLSAIAGRLILPERAVLVTFDDGLVNNATVAFPILKSLEIPATIFLTVDFIGTNKFFWVDELYIYLVEAGKRKIPLPLDDWPSAAANLAQGHIWAAYFEVVEQCKRMSRVKREEFLSSLALCIEYKREDWAEDFGLLSWGQVKEMAESTLVDFGVHTATHQILTTMGPLDEERELVQSKVTMERRLGREVSAFCYPNGRSGIDFTLEHQRILKEIGYECAFSTDRGLYAQGQDQPFAIRRIAAGNDLSSAPSFFRMNTAGIDFRRFL